jgi:hypothetical protein
MLTATLFGITDDLGLPARWLGASLGGLVAIAMVL